MVYEFMIDSRHKMYRVRWRQVIYALVAAVEII